MDGYLSGLLGPHGGAGPPPGGGHPGPPPIPGGGGPPPPRHPGIPGYPSGMAAISPGIGLAPPHHSYQYEHLVAAQHHHDMYVREATLRAQGIDMQRMVETQRIEQLRAAEARANSFLNPYSKDPLSTMIPSGHPYPESLRDRDLRDRNALVQSAFSMGSLYPPGPLLPPQDHYLPPLGPPPPPSSYASTRGTPDQISPSLASPHQRPRDSSPKVLPPALSSSTFSPHSRGSSPFLPPAPPSTNNSGLAEKLKVGFGDRSPQTPSFTKSQNSPHQQDASPDSSPSLHRRLSPQEGVATLAGPPYSRTAGHHTTTQASFSSTLVTNSKHQSGLNFPLSSYETSSKVGQSSWKPSKPAGLKQEEPEIHVIESEDEEEEVLVDDFDGQCCRTYPYNHSKIQRWREGKNKQENERKETSKHLANVQTIKIPTSSPEKSINSTKQADTITTAAGSIPVGIVSARQRTDQEKLPLAPSGPRQDLGSMPLPPSGPLVSGLSGPPACGAGMGPSTWSSGPPPPWAMTGQPPPGAQVPSPYGPPPPWGISSGPPPPMGMGQMPGPGGVTGPIPMGYQLAKDPMTGQILLIPTDHTGQLPPSTPGFGYGFDSMSGMPTRMPPTSSASQHLHHLMMQQQHIQYMQHQDMMQQQLRHGMHPSRPRVPETITVSDDDEEDCSKDKVSSTAAVVVTSACPPPNPTKESRIPTPLLIKREIVKTEFKTEASVQPPNETFTESQQVDVKSDPNTEEGVTAPDKTVSIKQERQDRSSVSTEESASGVEETEVAPILGCEPRPDVGCEPQPVLGCEPSPILGCEPEPQPIHGCETKPVIECDSPSVQGCELPPIKGCDPTHPTKESELTPIVGCEPLQDCEPLPVSECESQPSILKEEIEDPIPVSLLKKEIKSEVPDTSTSLCEDTKLCAEALLLMSESSTPSTCNGNFALEHQEPMIEGETEKEPSGFDILFQGLELLTEGSPKVPELSPIQTLTALAGLDVLCSVTRNDTFEYGLSQSLLADSSLDLGLLCAITAEDYKQHLDWIDPIVKLKKSLNVKKYLNQSTETKAKDFITMKIKQFTKDHPESMEEEKYDNIKMLAKMVKKIKNMEIMSQLEVDMRLKITELQNTFREKQKCLSKLKTPKKRNMKNKKGKQRGPGRPKKKKFPNPKSKMGRPRKHPKVVSKFEPVELAKPNIKVEKIKSEQEDVKPETKQDEPEEEEEKGEEEEKQEEEEEDVEPESLPDSDAPPVLEPQKHYDGMNEESFRNSRNRGSNLLKPPRLTASSPPPPQHKDYQSSTLTSAASDTRNTTLSTLTSKFMKGKANPFANLMSKLAGPPSFAGPGEAERVRDEDDEEEDDADEEDDDDDEEEEKEEVEDEKEEEDEEAVTNTDGLKDDEQDEQQELDNFELEGVSGEAERSISGDAERVGVSGEVERGSISGEGERSSSEKSSDDSSSETGSMMSPTRDCSFQFGKTSKLGYGLEAYRHSKKRKADKPKKHSGGSSETIVPKKPKNLFMMMDFQRGFNTKSAEDEYNFDENDEDKSYENRGARKESLTPSGKCRESQYQEWTDDDLHGSPVKRKHKKSKSFKSKNSKKERDPCSTVDQTRLVDHQFDSLRSAQLRANDLKDGLRILMLQEGKFWPARLNSTKLPDVYGVVMDRQRGNRPIILPRDDILKEAVLEIRPTSVQHLPIGARVCTLWSSALTQLFPGTITTPDEILPEGHVLVELDDGDSRLVEMSKIRMLPTDYSRVVYDPDPIASLRKRRISTDSHDSTASHSESRACQEQSVMRKSSKLADNSIPNEVKKKIKSVDGGKIKKKHKKCSKHGHHHCHKHKHKRHKSGGEVGSSSGIKKIHEQKFAIRSPPHGGGNRYVKSDPGNETSEASQEESDQQNSSDEEGGPSQQQPRASHHDLTPQKGREMWQWAGEGYRRPGGKAKSKKLFFRSIQRGRDSLHVNDCAVFLSTGRSDRPYIGKIEMLWETGNGSMMVKVKWFYHPEEIETCGGKFDLKLPGGLFQSPHTDENSVHTISHECEVLPIKEYTRLQATDTKRKPGALYYLAGSYDPAGLTVHFQPGVLQSNSDSD